MEENSKNYISLFDAAKKCSYSEPYLRLRARQGKLKSLKLGKKWMTTAAWIDDYQARVQAWREQNEAKKANGRVAALVGAPVELSGNLDQDGPPTGATTPAAEVAVVFADNAETSKPAEAVFCSVARPVSPAKARRLSSFSPSGQIFPVPKQTQIDNVSGFGWFGALLSGAVCALALFLAINQVDILNIVGDSFGRSGQANISRGVLIVNPETERSSGVSVSMRNGQQQLYFQFLEDISLKSFVDSVELFLKQ